MKISLSHLPINAKGAIYHLNLMPEDLADTIIAVGDPARVPVVSNFFDEIEYKKHHREFVIHTGYYKNKRITALSTGMGTPCLDIVINELDVLANVDFKTGEVRNPSKSLDIIRIGTTGALQADLKIGDFIVTDYALGLDGLLHYYKVNYRDDELQLFDDLITHFGEAELPIKPYFFSGSSHLLKRFSSFAKTGMTVTAPGFYGPQDRLLRGEVAVPGLIDKLMAFKSGDHRFLNFEMESSALYGLGRLFNHNCCTVCTVIANRRTGEFCMDYSKDVERLVECTLDQLTCD